MKYEGPLEGISVRDTTSCLCSLGNKKFAEIWDLYRRFKSLAGFRVDRTLEEYKAEVPPEQKDLVRTIEAIVNAEKWYRRQSFERKPWVSPGLAARNTDNYMAMIKYHRTETIVMIAEKELREALKDNNITSYSDNDFRKFSARTKHEQEKSFMVYWKYFSQRGKRSH